MTDELLLCKPEHRGRLLETLFILFVFACFIGIIAGLVTRAMYAKAKKDGARIYKLEIEKALRDRGFKVEFADPQNIRSLAEEY